MSRIATGTVAWRGNPARWWARLTVLGDDGSIKRPWVDLERPDLKNTPEDKKAAKAAALTMAKIHSPPAGLSAAKTPVRSKKSTERMLLDAIGMIGGIDCALEFIGRLTDAQIEKANAWRQKGRAP